MRWHSGGSIGREYGVNVSVPWVQDRCICCSERADGLLVGHIRYLTSLGGLLQGIFFGLITHTRRSSIEIPYCAKHLSAARRVRFTRRTLTRWLPLFMAIASWGGYSLVSQDIVAAAIAITLIPVEFYLCYIVGTAVFVVFCVVLSLLSRTWRQVPILQHGEFVLFQGELGIVTSWTNGRLSLYFSDPEYANLFREKTEQRNSEDGSTNS
jgi:hypothetical protein